MNTYLTNRYGFLSRVVLLRLLLRRTKQSIGMIVPDLSEEVVLVAHGAEVDELVAAPRPPHGSAASRTGFPLRGSRPVNANIPLVPPLFPDLWQDNQIPPSNLGLDETAELVVIDCTDMIATQQQDKDGTEERESV